MKEHKLKENQKHGTSSFPCAFYEYGKPVPCHWHGEYEINYVESGTYTYIINDERITMGSGFNFINKGEIHSIIEEEKGVENAVVFHMEMLAKQQTNQAQEYLIQPLIDGRMGFPRIVSLEDAVGQEILPYYKDIEHASMGKECPLEKIDNPVAQLMIETALLRIIAILERHGLMTRNFTGTENHKIEQIKKILIFVKEHYHENINVKLLAELVNMNEQYFSRFFKKYTDKSPMVYVNDYRINVARKLLVQTNLSIVDICMEVGFNNMGNFIRAFKVQTQLTPIKYRNMRQKG